MARGITESQVHTAADELVGAGERPTVERIRAHLGTGSPNTVTRWLDTWWQGLGERLQVQQAKLAVPDAPEAVADLAGAWWALALEHARTTVLEALAADRDALREDQKALGAEREDFAAEAATLHAKVAAASQAEHLASTQTAELQRLASRLEAQVEEMTQQRDAALARATEVDAQRQAVEVRIQTLRDTAAAERDSLNQHVRAVEDRAHAEIDRARQEAKDLQNRLATLIQEQGAAEQSLIKAMESAKTRAADATRDADVQRARGDALEAQLAKLRDLPAALEAALQRNKTQPKARKVAKRVARTPGKRARVSTGR